MLDLKLLRNNIKTVAVHLANRGYILDIKRFQNLEQQRHSLQIITENLQEERNNKSKKIGQLKGEGKDISSFLLEMGNLAENLKQAKEKLKNLKYQMRKLLAEIPNLPAKGTPIGKNEMDNVQIRRWQEPRKFDFPIKDHTDIGKNLKGMDFETSSKLTGSRFVVMYDKIACLHRALAQFMLDTHTQRNGYQEVYVPYLVNEDSLFGTGQLPKFSEDLFNLKGDFEFSLIPTAEVALINIVRNKIVAENDLPIKFVACTPCFRSEAGSYGADSRGMIRQHQFDKVELVQIVSPDNSLETLKMITEHAEFILRQLKLPYRVLQLCSSDMGFSASKTYDLEVWLPSENNYREVSSCSWCGDFQARRMKARFKRNKTKKTELLHTLNGSALAVGRTLSAILENYQQQDGSVIIPEVLRKYMNGLNLIKNKQ